MSFIIIKDRSMCHMLCATEIFFGISLFYTSFHLCHLFQQPTSQSMQNQPQLQSLGRMRKVEDKENQNEIQMRSEAIYRKHMLPSHLRLHRGNTYIQTNQDHHLAHASQDSYKSCKWSCICCQANLLQSSGLKPTTGSRFNNSTHLKTLINAGAQLRV